MPDLNYGATALGYGATVQPGGEGGVAIGDSATAGSAVATAIGAASTATGNGATALGAGSLASGYGATTVGIQSEATGDYSTAFGQQSWAAGAHSTALGVGAVAASDNSSVLGSGAQASANNAVAIGYGASATTQNSVALGSGATTGAVISTANGVIGGTTYTYAGVSPTGTVSVGTAGAERTITNVAAGQVTATSTDAVNGSQLFAVGQAVTNVTNTVNNITNGGGIKYFHTNSTAADSVAAGANSTAIGGAATAAGANDIVMGSGATTTVGGTNSTGAIAIGMGATAYGSNAISAGANVAMGHGAVAGLADMTTSQATAIGTAATASNWEATALGFRAQATGIYSDALGDSSVAGANYANAVGSYATASQQGATAVGYKANANATNAVALGNGANASVSNSVALGNGATTAAAVGTASGVIGGATYTYAGTNPTGTVSVGTAGAERTITNVAAGRVTVSSTDAVNGSQLNATNTQVAANTGSISTLQGNVTDLGSQITSMAATMGDAVMYDSSAHGSVTLGGVGATTPVALHNVAAGAVNASSFDAVNGSQLYNVASSTASAMGGGSTVNSDGSISAPTYSIGGNTFNSIAGVVTNLDGRVTQNSTAISNLQGDITNMAGTMGDAVMYDSQAHNSVTLGGVGSTMPVALHNVASGALNASSNDAVNGSQLYATNQQVAQNTSAIAQNTTDIANLQSNVTTISGQVANAIAYDSSAHDSLTLGGTDATTAVALHNVAAGDISASSTDAVNGSQVYALSQAISNVQNIAQNATDPMFSADGDRNTGAAISSGTHSTAAGALALASGAQATAMGAGSTASGVNSTAIGANSTATASNSVALGAGSVADRDNTVSVGSAGNERQITSVAAGTQGTDAVNVNQLNAAVGQSQNYITQQIAGVQNQISDVRRDAFGAAAAAMAVAGLPQPNQPGKTMVAAGTSRIGGQTGTALGVSYATQNNHWIGKLAVSSSSQGSTGVTAAAGYQW
ncbi:YadA-like family protein [Paraburkholderia eburnea]|uniref:YadA-like family protein n=1 Tax=Paraburkholderia eburnea TaxID=1189126 RepID=UPI001FC97422|nr:YadA-like family protein [Paraburkholderia eburnea]